MRYANVRKFVAAYPWAIQEDALDLVVEILGLHVEQGPLSEEQLAERLEAAHARPAPRAHAGNVAVLPLVGPIIPRGNLMSQSSGVTSARAFAAMLQHAVESPDVSAIVLDVDSPGGSVFGIEELAATIRGLRGEKPIVAVANTLAASAAYWLATQADELIVSPSSQVGSIGVLWEHEDRSGAEERAGVKKTRVTTAKYKAELAGALTDEAQEAAAALAMGYHRAFVADVARGRGVSRADVEEKFGQGRVVAAGPAVKAGMADAIGTIDQVIARLASGRKRVAASMAAEGEPLEELHEHRATAIDAASAPDDEPANLRIKLAEIGL